MHLFQKEIRAQSTRSCVIIFTDCDTWLSWSLHGRSVKLHRHHTGMYSLGSINARPSYHSQSQLWPVGYQARWQDAAAGTFHCDILEGGEEGPFFSVSLVPPQPDQPAQVRHTAYVHSQRKHSKAAI